MELIAVHSIMLSVGREIYAYDREGDPLFRVRTKEVRSGERFTADGSLARELIESRAAVRADDVRAVEELHDRRALLSGGLTSSEERLI